jgi:hypothetical protein
MEHSEACQSSVSVVQGKNLECSVTGQLGFESYSSSW